jgi:translation initiation factor 2-alpha kinase 3
MSSFFRSAADVSESGEESSIISRSNSSYDLDIEINAGNLTKETKETHRNHHQNVLLHALLEERCVNEVLVELNNDSKNAYTKDDTKVQSLGHERYLKLCEPLAQHGLINAGPEANSYRTLRQSHRDGLTLLSQNVKNGLQVRPRDSPAIPAFSARQITGAPHVVENIGDRTSDHRFESLLPNHSILDSTRYVRDFDEVGLLGSGGYGRVFHVQHKLDGLAYAVKKVPLGPDLLHKIQHRGKTELDAILNELRTMAKMEHPNIVRYYNGWIEWSTSEVHLSSYVRRRTLIEGPNAIIGSADSELDVVFSNDEIAPANQLPTAMYVPRGEPSFVFHDDQGIVFESSISNTTQSTTTDSDVEQQAAGGGELERIRTRSTIASVSDEDVEEIARDISALSTDGHSSTNAEHDNIQGPRLTLHIQMSLYTMTLTRYLSTDSINDSDAPLSLRHCFHVHGATQLLLAILDGVEYLHSEGIVHRDLKPGNIFMGLRLSTSGRVPAGFIDPFACKACQEQTDLPETTASLSVCIGDFGLVSKIRSAREEQDEPAARAVGTELYRPIAADRGVHPSLDIYSLGIIFFELLWPFKTSMLTSLLTSSPASVIRR